MAFGFGMRRAGRRGAGVVNLLADSWQMQSAFWSGDNPNFTEFGGQADPWGGTSGFIIMSDGAASAWQIKDQATGQVYAAPASICLSAFYKGFTGAQCNGYQSLRFYNVTDAALYAQQFNCNSTTGAVTLGGTPWADGSGVIDLGSGWYRLYVALDLAGRVLNAKTIKARVECFNGTPAIGQMFYLTGLQVNAGLTPAPYQRRPA